MKVSSWKNLQNTFCKDIPNHDDYVNQQKRANYSFRILSEGISPIKNIITGISAFVRICSMRR